ncbi:MAG: hypothetical protein IK119_07195 [Bacteroidales bacterium]|nr:hypothetical protein [Bacteroidales bacterium]
MAKYRLLLFKTQTSGVEITNLCRQIKWRGRKGAAARSIIVSLIDDDGAKHDRAGIDVAEGHQVVLELEGEEVFRGIVMRTTQNNKKLLSFTAYDNGIYLSNNKDTFCYENRTADYIFRDVMTRFGLPIGAVSPCTYVIPELIKSRTTLWDVVADALSLDYDNTQTRHYVSSSKGKFNLLTRKENILQWVLEPTANLVTYSLSRSIEKTRTRVKLLSDEGTVLAEAADTAMEAKIGVFQDVDNQDETLTLAQLTALAKSICAEKAVIENTMTLDATGIKNVISGVGVFVRIEHLGISRTYYVDEDTHILEGEKYTMRLKLNVASDIVMR